MKKTKIAAAALAAVMLAGGCAQNKAPAASETTTTASTTTTAAETEQTTTAEETTDATTEEPTEAETAATEETTADETAETEAETSSVPEPSDLFTLEDYGLVMKNVPDSLMDMNATAGRNMAFILYVDKAMLGESDAENEMVFYSLNQDDLIYGEYHVDVRKAADPELPTLPSGEGEDIVAVPVLLRDIIEFGELDITKIKEFYITKNFEAIKQVSIAPYAASAEE